jgi:hypothetical protein
MHLAVATGGACCFLCGNALQQRQPEEQLPSQLTCTSAAAHNGSGGTEGAHCGQHRKQELRDAALAATRRITAHVQSGHLAAFGTWITKHGQNMTKLQLSHTDVECAVNNVLPCGQLCNLTHLSFGAPAVDDSAAQMLGTLVGLRHLELDGVNMTMVGLSALAQLTSLTTVSLTRLDTCIYRGTYALEHVFGGRHTFVMRCTVRAVHVSQSVQRCV